jgi:kynurenine 3-monooxygenase
MAAEANSNKNTKGISIIGGGPVGSLLSIYLARKNFPVHVYEKRSDLRGSKKTEGRSINLALSHRGLKALYEVGLEEKIKEITVPMKGRMIHKENGDLNLLPYGEAHQFINSISRNELNQLLISHAENIGVNFHFNTDCESIELETGNAELISNGAKISIRNEIIIGADGAFSEVRKALQKIPDYNFEKEILSHGYKELHIPASNGKHGMEKNALHIWPREQFMLIALPNMDGSFTATLFLPFTGANSFEEIKTEKEVTNFFAKFFPDALQLIPDLEKDFFTLNPSTLVTVHCYPWVYKNKIAVIGDAAHAITPFYGQGMNAGFEDCRILNSIIDDHLPDWNKIFQIYQEERKENADAIAELALQNFIEMRDLVADPKFVLRKKIEAKIHQQFPSYLPLYSMVTFSDIPYKEALEKGKEHDKMMEHILNIPDVQKNWETPGGWKEIEKTLQAYLK